MKTLYQVTWIEHTRGAKNKASLQGVATSDWANARLYDRLATVLATSPQDAAKQLQAMILPHDPRPLSCTSYLPQYAVKPLRIGQEVVCPAHGRWYEEREDGGLREGTWTHGVVAELLGDDPATATVGLHLYRETVTGSGLRTSENTRRDWYTGPCGERITVDFPVRQLKRIK